MRKILQAACLCLMFAYGAHAQDSQPYYGISVDLQLSGEQFLIDRTYAGNNTLISCDVFKNSVAFDLTGWSFTLFYARDQYSTSGVPVAQSSVSSNRIYFLGSSNVYSQPFNDYWVSVIGTSTGGLVKTFGTGRMIVDYDPAADSPNPVSELSPLNWNLYGPYSGSWPFFAGSNITLSGTSSGLLISAQSTFGTGTPVYVEADPVWLSEKSGYATGTPLYVESYTGSVGSLSGYMPSAAVTQAINALSYPLASGTGLASRVAAVEGAGYAVNGQNITGRWFAVDNTNSGINAWVGGGYANSVTGSYASVGGGYNNSAAGSFASVFGGYANIADGLDASVGGGYKNSASGSFASVCGGYQNSAAGYAASVGGGWQNSSAGLYSTIPGGRNNYAANYAFASGSGARATNDGSFVVSLPGDTNATFGSRGDNTFNVRSVGGAYFLSSGLWIQDTNGNTIAAFTPTNSTLSGSLNLTGYATTSAVSSQASESGLGATNFGLAIGAGATALVAQASAQSTNFALAVGAGSTNAANGAGLVATNALTTAQAAQVQASNINAGAWSQILTNAADANNYAITNVDYIAFGTNTLAGSETNAIGIFGGHPSWVKAPGSMRTLASSDNLSSLGIQTTSGFNSSITNYARTTPTGYSFPSAWNDSVGINGDLVRDGTNMAYKSANVWVRWTVSTNW